MKRLHFLLMIVVSYWIQFQPAQAQSTIFNVPSADPTPKGQVMLESESQFRPWKPGAYYDGTEYSTLGIGHNTELACTVINITSPAEHITGLAPGFKSCIPILAQKFKEREFKVTVGEMVPIQIEGHSSVGSWTFGHLSGRIPVLKTRITAGVSAGTRQIFGRNAVSFIGAYEQPITKRLALQGDWFSGTNFLGYFIPGCSYVLPGNFILYAGYQIPNSRRVGRSGLVLELQRYFPLVKTTKGP